MLSSATEMRLESDPIELPDGWSGIVVTRAVGGGARHSLESLPRPADWQAFLRRLVVDGESIPGYAALKVSRSVEVIRGQVASGADSMDVVCKHARGSARRRAMGLWRTSRERRNFTRALLLLEHGLETALPLAVVERRGPRRDTWLVTAYIADLVDLDQVVLMQLPQVEPRRRRRVKNALIDAVVRLCIELEESGLIYRDMKASNIMLTQWDERVGPLRTALVDLDGLRRRRMWEGRRQWRALSRLAASLTDRTGVTRSDFGRFLRAYLVRTGADPASWKRRFSDLQRRVADYARREHRRKRHKFDGYTGGE